MLRRAGGLARPGSMIKPMAVSAAQPAAQPGGGPQAPSGVNRFIRQRIFALGQDFDIKHASG